jgi:hypothetical protein
MTIAELFRYAGWPLFVSAFATILGLVTLIMFFSLGQPWGTINDITSVVLTLSIVPVLLVLHRLHLHKAPTISLAAFVIGVLAMLAVIVFQTLLIIRVIAFAQTAVVVPVAFGLFGASLMVYGYLACAQGGAPSRIGCTEYHRWGSLCSGDSWIHPGRTRTPARRNRRLDRRDRLSDLGHLVWPSALCRRIDNVERSAISVQCLA